MSSYWENKKVLVSGGAGFIGSYVVDNLVKKRKVPKESILIPRSDQCDLGDLNQAQKVIEGCDVVFHLAAKTGGIAFSRAHPFSQYQSCSRIDLNVFEACRIAKVSQLVSIANILVYPESAKMPLSELTVFDGPLAKTHLGVGLAKRNLIMLSEMANREYDMNATVILSANTYGPRDRFDPKVSHVIPATIHKCFTEKTLNVWGDGTPTRDFLYVEDVAEGMVRAAERLTGFQYLNIGSGREVSIKELVTLVAKLTDFKGSVEFDSSKGGGDPRRVSDDKMAREILDFSPEVTFEEGLRRTIDWYKKNILPSFSK